MFISKKNTNVLIPMAGLGSRMPLAKYGTIKPLIKINNQTMIELAVQSLGIDGLHIFIYRDGEDAKKLESILKKIPVKSELVRISELTRGPAESCLAAKNLVNNNSELLIVNSDQIMWWNSKYFMAAARTPKVDGMVVTFSSNSPKNSYARLDQYGKVVEIREKEVISEVALAGIHYWRRGKDFVFSTEAMIKDNNTSMGEYYVGPSYNYLISKGAEIGIFHIPEFQHNPVGVPEDLDKFEEKIANL